MFCLKQNDKIIAVAPVQASAEWVECDGDYVYSFAQNQFVLSSEIDVQAEEQAIAQQQAEEQAIAEEEALKPTVEDLAEALDILTGIVLGGAE